MAFRMSLTESIGVTARYPFRFNGSIFAGAALRTAVADGFAAFFFDAAEDLAAAFGFVAILAAFWLALAFFFAAFAILIPLPSARCRVTLAHSGRVAHPDSLT